MSHSSFKQLGNVWKGQRYHAEQNCKIQPSSYRGVRVFIQKDAVKVCEAVELEDASWFFTDFKQFQLVLRKDLIFQVKDYDLGFSYRFLFMFGCS